MSELKPANRDSVPKGTLSCYVCSSKFQRTSDLRRHLNDSQGATHEQWRRDQSNHADPIADPSQDRDAVNGDRSQDIGRARDLIPRDLLLALENADLCHMQRMPLLTHTIWKESGRLPELVPAETLYVSADDVHTERQLQVACLSALHSGVRIMVNGMENEDLSPKQKSEMLYGLAYDFRGGHRGLKSSNTCIGAGILLPKDTKLTVPHTASGRPSMKERELEALWTVAGNVTDFHIDSGEEVLSLPVGECEKLFIMYPPTATNLKAFGAMNSGKSHILEILSHTILEGGIMCCLDSHHALHIPSGVIHAVITLRGGFLIGRNFICSATLTKMSQWLHFDCTRDIVSSEKLETARLSSWVDAIDSAEDIGQVVEAWRMAKDRVIVLLTRRPKMKQAVIEALRIWLRVESSLDNELATTRAEILRDLKAISGPSTGGRLRA